jgi:hypothetical protein
MTDQDRINALEKLVAQMSQEIGILQDAHTVRCLPVPLSASGNREVLSDMSRCLDNKKQFSISMLAKKEKSKWQ